MIRSVARRRGDRPERFRRGVYLLPSLMTVSNLLCGYASVVYSTRGDFDTAAVLLGIAMQKMVTGSRRASKFIGGHPHSIQLSPKPS